MLQSAGMPAWAAAVELGPDTAAGCCQAAQGTCAARAAAAGDVVLCNLHRPSSTFINLHQPSCAFIGPVQPNRFFQLAWGTVVAATHRVACDSGLDAPALSRSGGLARTGKLVAGLSAAASDPPDKYTQALAMRGLQTLAKPQEQRGGLGAVRAGMLGKLLEQR